MLKLPLTMTKMLNASILNVYRTAHRNGAADRA